MQEHGRVIVVMQPRTGISPRTNMQWMSQEYVILVEGRWERKVMFSLWGQETIAKANLQLGEYITVHADVDAHEFEGRWFNEIRAYDIEKKGVSVLRSNLSSQPAQIQQPLPTPQVPPVPTSQVPSNMNTQVNNYQQNGVQNPNSTAPNSSMPS